MGKNYQSLLQYELAEQSFKKASNLVPNRLYPHYLLAKLYHEIGLNEKAQVEANIVLTKKPKVDSQAIEEMREELRELRIKN
jgi:tetratricopeptide (TPR) repeat protein